MYLSVLIGGGISFQISFSASRGPCICYFLADDTIVVFITEILVMYTSSKKSDMIRAPGLKMVQPPRGSLAQAYCTLGNFHFHRFIP